MTTIARGLVDTNVAIRLGQIVPGELPAEIVVSAVTMAELAAGPHHVGDANERAGASNDFAVLEDLVEVHPVTHTGASAGRC